ncbi:MAG TPA: class I SAM-dependent methyltransferase [Terriglobales bacterium]|nr:class I SAM-dependent methyltransferase [Terriglobales bacterium]
MATPILRRAPEAADLAAKALNFLQELLRDYHPRNFAIELWDGTCWEPEPGQFRRFTWKIQRAGAVRSVFSNPNELAFAEAYIGGDFDIEGDVEGIFPLSDYFLNKNWSPKQKLRLQVLLSELPNDGELRLVRCGVRLSGRIHSRERDLQAISYHYDISNNFYSLWLGKEMQYSCAYFQKPEDDLDKAQRQKLDYICRKLRLQAGERLLDIGCGWGGLIIHAAREYGVNAVGITLSQQQFVLAQQRISQADLAGRCQVKLMDYRDLTEPDAYDKISSVGMVEHVGGVNLTEYFRRAFRSLRSGGVFLNVGIGAPQLHSANERRAFTGAYVFPDNELSPIGTITQSAESAGFEVRDVENLREHYALTLRHWLRGLEQNAEQARRLVDEVTYRIWRLHMAGSAYSFQSGKLNWYQTLLVKNDQDKSGVPLTRADWYTKQELATNSDFPRCV